MERGTIWRHGTATSVLDNVVWHALEGPQAHLGSREGAAARFDTDVSPFSALADISSPQAWDDLGALIGEGAAAMLFAPSVDVPPGWSRDIAIPCVQMVATDVIRPSPGVELVELGPSDVDDMLELAALARPGPFDRRTIELGTYLGLREGGRLVAMAGERFKVPGYTEISAVATAPSHRGKGLGAATVLATTERIRERGEEAYLHVLLDNAPAIALYTKLGFTVRLQAEAVAVRPVAVQDVGG